MEQAPLYLKIYSLVMEESIMGLQNLIKKYGEDHPVNKDGWLEMIPLADNKRDPEENKKIWENGVADVKRIVGQEEES